MPPRTLWVQRGTGHMTVPTGEWSSCWRLIMTSAEFTGDSASAVASKQGGSGRPTHKVVGVSHELHVLQEVHGVRAPLRQRFLVELGLDVPRLAVVRRPPVNGAAELGFGYLCCLPHQLVIIAQDHACTPLRRVSAVMMSACVMMSSVLMKEIQCRMAATKADHMSARIGISIATTPAPPHSVVCDFADRAKLALSRWESSKTLQ